MKIQLNNFLRRRGLAAAAPLLTTCLLLAGCGSSSKSSSPNQSASTKTSTTASASTTTAAPPPASGSALAAGLIKSMGSHQPQLKSVKPSCPGTLKAYPVKCRFTATETAMGKKLKLAGTITVSGGTGNNYEYGLNYAPVTH